MIKMSKYYFDPEEDYTYRDTLGLAMKIAEFMGWETIGTLEFPDAIHYYDEKTNKYYSPQDWRDWMREVEPRIREQGLWEIYIDELIDVLEIERVPYWGHLDKSGYLKLTQAALDQRASALERVLEERE
jgi:hypothetical protein